MRKVVTPTRAEVQTTTIVVIVTVFIFAAYFELVDLVLGTRHRQVFSSTYQALSPAHAKKAQANGRRVEQRRTSKPMEHDRRSRRAEPETGEEAGVEAAAPAHNENFKWYIIHAYSGFERKVKESLQSRVAPTTSKTASAASRSRPSPPPSCATARSTPSTASSCPATSSWRWRSITTCGTW